MNPIESADTAEYLSSAASIISEGSGPEPQNHRSAVALLVRESLARYPDGSRLPDSEVSEMSEVLVEFTRWWVDRRVQQFQAQAQERQKREQAATEAGARGGRIYECDECSAVLPPGVMACPNCGEPFDQAVPADAELPRQGFRAVGPAAAPSDPILAPASPEPAASEVEVISAARWNTEDLLGQSNDYLRLDTPSAPSFGYNLDPPSSITRSPLLIGAQDGRNAVQDISQGLREYRARKITRTLVAAAALLLLGVGGIAVGTGKLSLPDEGAAPSPVAAATRPEHTVTYRVTGTARSVQVSYKDIALTPAEVRNLTGQQERSAVVSLPWSTTITSHDHAFIYVSAQNQGENGTVNTEILVDGNPVDRSTTTEKFGFTSASGNL